MNVENNIILKSPVVSVVMPVYNMEKYVAEAVDSILNQTFSALELVIVDDGSTDHTTEILHSFIDPRIRILTNDCNEGNYPARNRGWRLAKGKYIAVMDADDIAFPERLEKQVEFMEAHPDVLAVGAGTMFWPFQEIAVSDESIRVVLLLNNCFIHSSLFVRRKTMISLGGYDEQYIYASDYDLVTRIALLGKLDILNFPLVYYRWHDDQITVHKRKEQAFFAGKIGSRYREMFIHHYLPSGVSYPEPAMLSHTQMAIIIALFIYSRAITSSTYEQLAESMLDHVIDHLSAKMPLCLKDGLLGFVCGCCYLRNNGFIIGDTDEMFIDIDELLLDKVQNDVDLQKEFDIYWLIRNQ